MTAKLNIQSLADFIESVGEDFTPMIKIIDCVNWCIAEEGYMLYYYDGEDLYTEEILRGRFEAGDFTTKYHREL